MKLPDRWWTVDLGDSVVRVSELVAQSLLEHLVSAKPPVWLFCNDIYGGQIHLRLSAIIGLYETTTELISRNAEHNKALDAIGKDDDEGQEPWKQG